MIKTRIIEVIVKNDNSQPEENTIGYTYLAEPVMERKVPEPGANGRMPPPLMIKICEVRYFIIGFTYDIEELGTEENPSESVYVIMVQKVPEMRSGLVKANAGAMDQIKALVPVPGSNRKQ